jgi:hypothetical protein
MAHFNSQTVHNKMDEGEILNEQGSAKINSICPCDCIAECSLPQQSSSVTIAANGYMEKLNLVFRTANVSRIIQNK